MKRMSILMAVLAGQLLLIGLLGISLGERRGNLRSADLPMLEVAAPPEFLGHEGVWIPEHLYVASIASCFMTTFLAIAENSKLEVVSFCATARGKLEKIEGLGLQITEVVLKPRVVVRNALDPERATRTLEKANKHCLISNSIKTEVNSEQEVYHLQSPVHPCPPIAGTAARF